MNENVNIESALKTAISDIAAIKVHDKNIIDEKEKKMICERYGYENAGGHIDIGSYPNLNALSEKVII